MFLKNAYQERATSTSQVLVNIKYQNAELNQTIVNNVDLFEENVENLIYKMDKKNNSVVRQTNVRKNK